MLRAVAKGETSGAKALSPEEDRTLRVAFGRYGGRLEDRAAGAAIVGRYQQLGAGYWFLCDCRPEAERPPALVPVLQTHIRRHHEDARWPAHAAACDFYRDPVEQLAITASYARPTAARPLRLARAFSISVMPLQQRTVSVQRHTTRPGLARLLAQLVTDAGLQRIEPDWHPPSLKEQARAIWTAAKAVALDTDVMLPEFLCTSPARLGELTERIARADPARFRRTRPHGVLVARVAAIGGGALSFVSGETVRVRGRLAVFAEEANGRDTQGERAARAPYLAACVLGRPSSESEVQVLSAYAHPCATAAHLMLVDSDLERRTLAQLRSVQTWLAKRKSVAVTIEKPMFDVGAGEEAEAIPRPPCIPDFVVSAAGIGGARASAIVETMGFADEEYRARKRRLHPMMSAALGGAPIVPHDFHEPVSWPQAWRDDKFWREVRWALSVSEDRATRRLARSGSQEEGAGRGNVVRTS